MHVDVKYLPQMADESRRTYLFVAIDRATRWVYLEILPDKSARSAKGFLKQLIKKAPFIITRVLTDNGKEFTDRFIANGERKPTGQHPFDQVCQAEGIEHRLIKPKHPQTNGMVERFNGRISEILATTHFDASRDLQETLYQYQKIYNYHVPQKNIGHITPIQALKDWHKKQPELFKKKIYDLSGLDTTASSIHSNVTRTIPVRVICMKSIPAPARQRRSRTISSRRETVPLRGPFSRPTTPPALKHSMSRLAKVLLAATAIRFVPLIRMDWMIFPVMLTIGVRSALQLMLTGWPSPAWHMTQGPTMEPGSSMVPMTSVRLPETTVMSISTLSTWLPV